MTEQVYDRHHLDAGAAGGVDEPRKLGGRVRVLAGHAGQAGVLHRILQVQVEFLVAPIGIARKLRDKPVQAFDLPGKVPLKRAKHGRGLSRDGRGA
jgi:hypothetical protein